MIIEGLTRGISRARATTTVRNIDLASASGPLMGRAVELVGGQFATYQALYETQPWVHATVNRLARGLGRLPLPIYIDGGADGERTRVRSGPLFDLVRRPWTTRTGGAIQDGNTVLLVQALVTNMLVAGFNVFVKGYTDDSGRRRPYPVSLMPSSPWAWWPVFEGGKLVYWNHASARGNVPFLPDEVWVVAPWGMGQGGMPRSPMAALRSTLMAEDAIQRAVIQRFEKGSRPVGFIAVKGELTPEQMKARREQLNEVYSGVDNFYRMGLLDNDASFHPMGQTFVESELISLRKLNREEVASVLNVPQPSVGILDRATFSNVSEQHLMEYMDTYGPPAVLIEESFGVQVIDQEPAFQGMYAEFNFKEVLRGDPMKELDILTRAAGGPVLTLNEARATQNLPPLPNGDEVREPQNMAVGGQNEPGNGTSNRQSP